jgi:very-short-patch-repair endonuclease
MKEFKEYMKNGGSAYAASFIKNPSIEELDFRKIVKELYPEAKHTYKVLDSCSYTVDNALIEEKIALEYDGWYHFNCQESIDYHNKRQKEIEAEGWRFIRYDVFQKFPTEEQIKNDVESLLRAN